MINRSTIKQSNFLIILIILCIITSISFVSFMLIPNDKTAKASTIIKNDLTVEQRKINVLNNIIYKMNAEYESNVVYNGQKILYDFCGNTYTLVECFPTGYIITCDASAEAVEYSSTSPSPYKDYSTNLYYGGPTRYFIKSDNEYLHTITLEATAKTVMEEQMPSLSAKLYNSVIEDVNEDNLNYINNGTRNFVQPYSYTSYGWTYVNNADFFKNLSGNDYPGYRMGYTTYPISNDPDEDKGVCGFIAANILLGYYDTFVNSNFIQSNCMTGSGVNRFFLNTSLTDELISIGESLNVNIQIGTTSTSIKRVMNKYFDNHGINANGYGATIPFFSGATIKNKLSNDIPVIVFGTMYNPDSSIIASWINHAVVIYGYCKNSSGVNKWGFMAHYGWLGYTRITVNVDVDSTFGSMYNITY